MSRSIIWNTAVIHFLVVCAILCGFVYGEDDEATKLCNQFKNGETKIQVMGQVASNQFLILDSDLRGFEVPMTQLDYPDRVQVTSTPSLDLTNARIYNLPGAAGVTHRNDGKGAFFLHHRHPKGWSNGSYFVLIAPDHKNLTGLPLNKDGGDPKPIDFKKEHQYKASTFFSCPPQSKWMFLILDYETEKSLLESSLTVTNGLADIKAGAFVSFWTNNATVDGGSAWLPPSMNSPKLIGFNNQAKMMYYEVSGAKGKVPFAQFFKCSTSPSSPTSEIGTGGGGPYGLIAGITGFVLLCMLVVLIIYMNKGKKRSKKSSRASKRGSVSGIKSSRVGSGSGRSGNSSTPRTGSNKSKKASLTGDKSRIKSSTNSATPTTAALSKGGLASSAAGGSSARASNVKEQPSKAASVLPKSKSRAPASSAAVGKSTATSTSSIGKFSSTA